VKYLDKYNLIVLAQLRKVAFYFACFLYLIPNKPFKKQK